MEILIGGDSVSSSINRVDPEMSLPIFSRAFCPPKLLALVDNDIALLLYPMQEGKGENGDGGDGWHDTSVFAMTLSQYVSFRDKVPLPGEIGRAPTLT